MECSRRVELLAPAGNAKGFYGAVYAGADAVYLAGDRFGARAYAENFNTEELVECIRYAHLLGRKIYLTVNTLLKEEELAGLYDYLAPFYEAGLDAVIVQDLGVIRYIREYFPGLKIHASTQMTLCSGYGASLLKDMGAERIVPARELSLQELISIKRHTEIEIETFIHGAMCYCYSGQCLFSSILGGRSGNRGRCAQPCRLPYSVDAGDIKCSECYPLSLKDMCTIEHIPQLIEAGIDSFKIEGRMKKPEYAAGVTAIYRRYIDKYYELRERKGAREAANLYKVKKADEDALRSLYIRSEIQDGYYFRRNGREMVTLDNPAYSGSSEALLTEIRGKYLDAPLKLPVAVKAVFHMGQPAEIVFQWRNIRAAVKGAPVEQAQKQPVTEENIRKQLGKLGDSSFYASDVEISLEEGCFYPLKQINELRREAVSELEWKILASHGYGEEGHRHFASNIASESVTSCHTEVLDGKADCPGKLSVPERNSHQKERPETGYVFSVCTIAQLETLAGWILGERFTVPLRIYIDGGLLLQEEETVLHLCGSLAPRAALFAALPYIIRETDREYLEDLYEKTERSSLFQGFLAHSLDGLGFVREKGGNLACRTDTGLYIWNSAAVEEIAPLSDGFSLPYELNAYEQKSLLNSLFPENLTEVISCEKIVYSRIPMMITANCLFRTAGSCRRNYKSGTQEKHRAVLRDRYRREFPVVADCTHCMNIIYNSVPFSLHRELSKWKNRADLRMDFTLESPAEVKELLDSFLKGTPIPLKEYTTGHEKRGVE